jgi:hypothetical protein
MDQLTLVTIHTSQVIPVCLLPCSHGTTHSGISQQSQGFTHKPCVGLLHFSPAPPHLLRSGTPCPLVSRSLAEWLTSRASVFAVPLSVILSPSHFYLSFFFFFGGIQGFALAK